jgi:hypothetical protein
MNSASLCSLAGRYENPFPPRCLAPIDFLKIPAQQYSSLFPTVLPYSFIPRHLFAVHGLFIAANTSHLFAVCRLFIAVKTIIICLLFFGSAQLEWGHLVNPQLCLVFLPFPAPVAISAVTLALFDLNCRYTQYGHMQPLL